jgi:hypothetical protein
MDAARALDRQRRTAWRLGAGGGETLRAVELEVEIGAEAPAGSPLTLSETGPLKPMLQLTTRSVRSGAALRNSTNGWNPRILHGKLQQAQVTGEFEITGIA